MTLDHLRYFMEVAYCRSFSQAAQNLYVSQPNLTKYIASLEKELGVKLLDRTTRRVELTEAGERLMSKSQTVLMPFLRELEDTDRDLFVGRYFHAYEVQKMAEAYGLTPNAASLRLYKTREKLRVYLNDRGYHV